MLSKLLKLNVAGAGCKLGVQVNPIQTRKAFGWEPLESPPNPPPLAGSEKKARAEVQTDGITPIIVGPTMVRVVTFVVAAVCKRMQQLQQYSDL